MKRMLSLFLALTMAASLAACGQSPASAPAGDAASSQPQSASASGESASGDAASGDAAPEGTKLEGTIEYWSLWNETEPQGQVIQEAVADFMAQNSGVTVNINWQGRDIRKTIKAALDAKQVDIWDDALQIIGSDYASYGINLEPLMNKAYPSTEGKTYMELTQPVLINALKVYSGGAVNGVPYQPNILPLWYNKDHFEQAGITEMPKTMDQFYEVCAKLKAAGFTPISNDSGYILLPFTMYLGRLKGVDFCQQLVNDKTGEMMNDPAFLEAAQSLEKLAKEGYYPTTVAANKYPAGQMEFAMGDVSMYLVPSYMVNEVLEIAGEDFPWGAMELPNPNGATLPTTATNLDSQCYQITKDCANPELAFALIAHITSAKWDAEMATRANAIPTMAATEWPANLSAAKPILEAMTENMAWAAKMNTNPDFTPTFKELLAKLSGGEVDAATFVAECQKAVKGG